MRVIKVPEHCAVDSRKLLRIYFAERPLREHHLRALAATKTRASNIALQAGWSNKSFAVSVAEVLGNLMDEYVLGRLKLNQQPLDPEELKRGVEDSQAFLDLCIAVAAQRAWTMSVHRICQPDSWMGVLDEQLELRRECFETLKRDVQIITDAWNMLESKDPNADLEAWVWFLILCQQKPLGLFHFNICCNYLTHSKFVTMLLLIETTTGFPKEFRSHIITTFACFHAPCPCRDCRNCSATCGFTN